MSGRSAIVAGVFVAAGFLWALYALLALEYESGENLPQYSTLRKDPLGASAFYEALVNLADVDAVRNRLPLHQWEPSAKGTLILAGMPAAPWIEDATIKRLEGYAAGGGRVVIAFFDWGEFRQLEPAEEESKAEAETADETSESSAEETDDTADERVRRMEAMMIVVSLDERWGFDFSFDDWGVTFGDEQAYLVTKAQNAPGGLPESLRWRGPVSFKDWDESWRVIYDRGPGRAAVIEKRLGQGTIALASDSYLISNEALRLERQTEYLAWLVGPHRRVVFDENHLGLAPAVGLMTLARQYGLAPVLAVFAVVFGLFLWRNATSLLPRGGGARETGELHVEKGASAALSSLLRRSADPKHLLRTCVETWTHTAKWQGRYAAAARDEVVAVFERLERETEGRPDPVSGYKRIRAVLEERKPKP